MNDEGDGSAVQSVYALGITTQLWIYLLVYLNQLHDREQITQQYTLDILDVMS